MQKEELEKELHLLQEAFAAMRREHEDKAKEPTLKEFSAWLSSAPDWGGDGVIGDTAKNMNKIINAFLCQEV